MSFTYTNNPAGRQIDAIRLELGDIFSDTHLIEDEDITYALTLENLDTLKTAAHLAEMLAARFAREEVLRTGEEAIDKGAVQEHFRKLAKDLRIRSVTTGQFLNNLLNASLHADRNLDTNLIQSTFRRGLHDNPEAKS